MTERRKRQLDAVARRFDTDPRSVYLLAGEVEGAREYVPKEGELRVPRTTRRKPKATMQAVDLDWVFA